MGLRRLLRAAHRRDSPVASGRDVWEAGCPGGESPSDASGRADQLITRLRDLTGKVALFSHGQFGRALAARWVGLPVTEEQLFAIDPASIGIFGFETDHPERRVISLWNPRADGRLTPP